MKHHNQKAKRKESRAEQETNAEATTNINIEHNKTKRDEQIQEKHIENIKQTKKSRNINKSYPKSKCKQ